MRLPSNFPYNYGSIIVFNVLIDSRRAFYGSSIAGRNSVYAHKLIANLVEEKLRHDEKVSRIICLEIWINVVKQRCFNTSLCG